MTPEEMILDMRELSIRLGEHFAGTQIIFGGYCQGAESSLRALATGKLRGVAHAALLGVAPIDPTDVGTLYDNHKHLLEGTTLNEACTVMPSGNLVIDGDTMRQVINYGNPEANNPVSELVRELVLCNEGMPGSSGLVMWYWLNRTLPLPPGIIALTNKGYENPMVDGVYGYELFGERPDLKRLGEHGIEHLFVGTAARDTLVKQEASTMLRTLLRGVTEVHLCQYDKGHLGIVRDCCREGSDEPLDGRSLAGQEGPVLWYRRVIRRKPLDPAPL
jgi:poly(3-hydroxyalkanoate) synthetase